MAQLIRFWDRVKMAWRILIDADYAIDAVEGVNQIESARTKTAQPLNVCMHPD